MKRLILLLLVLVLPGLAIAQQPQGFDPSEMMRQMQDPAAMQRMAAQAKAAQECMEGIDQSQLEALQKRAEASGKEIERLCAAGKKDEALAKGLKLSRELQSDATLKKLRECSEGLTEMMKGMPWAQMAQMKGLDDMEEPSDDDICR